MNAISVRPRSVGEILDGAFRLYRQDLGLYVFTAIVASLPLALVVVLSLGGGGSAPAAVAAGLLMLVGVVAMVVVWAALVYMMNERLQGREPGLGVAVRNALGIGHRVVWAGIVSYVALMGAMIVIMMGSFFVGGGLDAVAGDVVGVIAGALVAAVLMLVLGFRVFAGVTLFLPGIVIERLSGYGAVRRGLALTKKGAGRVTVVLVVAWILILIPMIAVYVLTGTATLLLSPQAGAGTLGMGQLAVQQFLVMLINGFTTPFMVACILLLYYDQRVRFEAFDLEAEASALAG
jgi:hypothetical protein